MKFKKLGLACLATVAAVSLASCNDTSGKGEYTYNASMSVFPTNWNPHTYQTNTDAEVLAYTTPGFYTFDYNDAKDGYKVVPDMATQDPIDVTADYVGDEWGIKEGETGKAYRIKLRKDIKWQDGTSITAADFVESAKLLLNPKANNYRADSLYSGDMVIKNSKEYLYQGKHAYETAMISADPATGAFGGYYTWDELTVKDGKLYAGENDFAAKINSASTWSSNSLSAYYKAGYLGKEGAGVDAYKRLAEAADENGVVVMTKALAEDLQLCVAVLQGFGSAQEYADALAGIGRDPSYAFREWQEFCFLGGDYPELSFDKVGVFEDNGDLILILQKQLKGFYLLYSLTSTWLVKNDLYKSLEKEVNGIYSNSYGTSVETFMSYGPYKLEFFQADKEMRFVKNEYYYEYNDESDIPLYQTTKIVYHCIPEENTREQEFLAGNLDSFGLSKNTMGTYSSSDFLYYTEGASTFFVALNPSLSGLTSAQTAAGANKNKTILTVLEFRQALSLALNRVDFCLACDPTGNPAKAVFNNLIISDPENGIRYRNSEEAKDVILNFWGLADQVGPGKRYATKDEAIDAITGYDLTQAKAKFNEAYDKAIADGLMDSDDVVELKIGLPNGTTPFYVDGYTYLENCWKEAVKGTKLEGKLTFTQDNTLGNAFSDALKNNQVDILFGVGWTGSALNPFNLAGAYTDPSYQYDVAIDYTQVTKDVHFDSVVDAEGNTHTNITLRATVDDWSNKALGAETISAAVVDANGNVTKDSVLINAGSGMALSNRTLILNAVEAAILEQYTMLPLNNDSSAALKGMKINYYTEEYIYGVGRGGVKYMTYNYDDYAWRSYVKSQGGSLKYN